MSSATSPKRWHGRNNGVTGDERFIFTVATGRCGQSSLTELVESHVPRCYAAFEEPDVRPFLPAPLDNYERLFRRRFVETHELLGRGKVLTAFERDDRAYIEGIASRRLRMIRKQMMRHGASIYFDISKYFARGLHVGFAGKVDRYALVNLVRDPVRNMRSFLNRNKTFTLDNSLPDAPSNLLRLSSGGMAPGEFYLWAWCELYLRFQDMRRSSQVTHAVEIRTEDLEDSARMSAAFDALGLNHSRIQSRPPRNMNRQQGLPETCVTEADIRLFEKFFDRIPASLRNRIAYLENYDPWRLHQPTAA
jgi:hypothetical protein